MEYSFAVSFFSCTVIGTDGERMVEFFLKYRECYFFLGRTHLVETAVSE